MPARSASHHGTLRAVSAMLLLFGLRVRLLALQGCQDGAWRHGQSVHADTHRLIDGVGQGR